MYKSQPRDLSNKEYIDKEINPILEPMMIEVAKNKPDN